MEITNNKYNTMPEQVQENKDNIKVLAEYIKEAYNATTTLAQGATTIDASMVRDWVAGTTTGFILDQVGKLFKIVAVSDNTIYIQWWASLPQGAQGATGATGAQGAKGDKGDAGVGFNNTTDINLVVGDPMSVTYDTEDGITIISQGGIEADGQTYTPTVENNIPIIAGNGLTMDATEDGKHVDMHLSAETQSTLARALKMPTSAVHETKLVAIDNTNAQTMLSIGDGLSVENGSLKASGGGFNIKTSPTCTTPQQIMGELQSLNTNGNLILSIEYTKQSSSSLSFNMIKGNIATNSVELITTSAGTMEAGKYIFNYIGKSPDAQGFMFSGNIANQIAHLRIYNAIIACQIIRNYMTYDTIDYGICEPSISTGFTAVIKYI